MHVPLAQDDRVPGQARLATREILDLWRLPALVDTVLLAVSELVTNGILHGRPQVALELRREARQIRVRVHDADPIEPASIHGRTAGAGAEGGRGLSIVGALADEVGVEQVPGDGKIVYASFETGRQQADDNPAT